MSDRDTLYYNVLGEVRVCLHTLTKRFITQCQDGLITVDECMNQLDGANCFNDALRLNMGKYEETDKI